ncbi:MAG: 50S ribosomal protein L10 [Acidobacteria bacterium]|nr:50S ribosomal protein L10 [Acidobacteriota bacterium]
MNRDEKKETVDGLKAELSKAEAVFVVNFQKIPVAEDLELRKQVRQAGGRYRVIKNTLARLSAQGTPSEQILKELAGPTALALTEANPVALAKALSGYAKANPNFTFRAGLVEGRAISISEIAALATMPGREELLAKVLYLLASPARGIATTLQAVTRNMASVLDQAVKEGKFSQ